MIGMLFEMAVYFDFVNVRGWITIVKIKISRLRYLKEA